jgi:hypothetical protein
MISRACFSHQSFSPTFRCSANQSLVKTVFAFDVVC